MDYAKDKKSFEKGRGQGKLYAEADRDLLKGSSVDLREGLLEAAWKSHVKSKAYHRNAMSLPDTSDAEKAYKIGFRSGYRSLCGDKVPCS